MESNKELPEFNKIVKIRFLSVRNGMRYGCGVYADMDKIVERYAYRKKTESGWKWQIKENEKLSKYDKRIIRTPLVWIDQSILDDGGEDIEVEII